MTIITHQLTTSNLLVRLQAGQPVTTTLAIAEGTKNQHKALIQLVRTYQADLDEFGLVTFEMAPRPAGQHGGGDVEYAVLNEDQATLLITYMKNTPIVRGFKKHLIKAFRTIRDHVASMPVGNPANLSRLQLITMALEAEQEREALSCQVEELTPKAVALDRIATHAEGSICPTNAAKVLQIRPGIFFSWLQEHHWIYRRPGGSAWLGYQDRIQSGLLEHKITTVSRGDGSEKVVEQVLITAKGLAKLASLFGEAV